MAVTDQNAKRELVINACMHACGIIQTLTLATGRDLDDEENCKWFCDQADDEAKDISLAGVVLDRLTQRVRMSTAELADVYEARTASNKQGGDFSLN